MLRPWNLLEETDAVLRYDCSSKTKDVDWKTYKGELWLGHEIFVLYERG